MTKYIYNLTFAISLLVLTGLSAFTQPRTLPIPSGNEEIDNLSKKSLDLFVNNKALNFSRALHIADSVKLLAEQKNSPEGLCAAYGNLAAIFKLNGNFTLAQQYVQKALDVAKGMKDTTFSLPQAYRLMGSVYMGQLNWGKALEYYFKSLNVYERSGNTVQQSLIISEIGAVYHRSKNVEKAKKYYIQALDLLRDKDPAWEVFFRNRLSTALLATGNYDESIAEANKTIAILKTMEKPWMLAMVTDNIAGAYLEKGELDKAEAVSRHVIELARKDSQDAGGYLVGLANILNAKNKKTEAEKIYKEAIEESVKRRDIYSELDGREKLTEFYKENKQLDKAYEESLKLAVVKDSVYGKDKAIAIEELEYKYQNEKKEEQIAGLTAQNKLKNWLVLAGGLAALCALLLLWYFNKNSRLSKALMLQKQETLEQEKQLETEQKEKAILNEKLKEQENKRLQNEMEATNRELATITLYVQEKNKLLEDLQNQLSTTISKSTGTEKTELQNINKTIRQSITFESDWDKIKLHFEKVHPQFFAKLHTTYPQLTQNELRHCAYIKMNMNNKETANLMNIDAASVKMSRYRIKKKLGLPPEDDLNNFIHKL